MNQSFPDWGYTSLVNGSSGNIVQASLDALRESGSQQITLMFAVATIPFMIMVIVYVRTRKLINAAYGLLMSTILIHIFGYLHPQVAWIIYSISGLMIAASMAGIVGRK